MDTKTKVRYRDKLDELGLHIHIIKNNTHLQADKCCEKIKTAYLNDKIFIHIKQ